MANLSEIQKESKSIADFIEDYFELSPGKPIELQTYQRDILECNAQFRVINKARQLGISSVMAWEGLAYAILIPNQTILLVSVAQRQADELMEYIKKILDNFRLKNHIKVVSETKSLLKLDNNSRLMSLPCSPRTVQGFRANRLYLDEFAIHEQDKEMLDAIIPSISHGGSITCFSRPFGKRGEFHRIFIEAKTGKNNFVPFEIPWTDCTMKIYRKMIPEIKKAIGELAFREQYCCEFIDEGTSFFPYELILPCIDDEMTKPKEGMELYFGIDFGRKINSTVITVAEYKADYKYIRDIKEFTGTPFSVQLKYINDKIKLWKPTNVIVDDFGMGMRLFEELREKHGSIITPAHMDVNMKSRMMTELVSLFENKKIRIPRNDKLMQQLHAIERDTSGGREKWKPGKTEDYGKHDDYVDSLGMVASHGNINQISYFVVGGGDGPEFLSDAE